MNEWEITTTSYTEIDHAMEHWQKFVRPKYEIVDNRDQQVREGAHTTIKPQKYTRMEVTEPKCSRYHSNTENPTADITSVSTAPHIRLSTMTELIAALFWLVVAVVVTTAMVVVTGVLRVV
jgi:predicted acetyltransferase